MAKSTPHLFWIDLEMTGLDPNKDRILEVAVLITNDRLHVVDRFKAVISTPKEVLDGMDAWNTGTHRANGLYAEAQSNGRNLFDVEHELLRLAGKYFANQRVILCGATVFHDKHFLEKHMPRFAKVLHYRVIDISGWKAIYQTLFGISLPRSEAHRAMPDIEESLNDLRTLLTYLDRNLIPEIADLDLGKVPHRPQADAAHDE